jgi:hypothetical protein
MLCWVVAIIVAVPVLGFGFSAAMGFIINPEVSGKALLKKKLKARGINPEIYGEPFLLEITQRAVRVAKMMKEFNKEHFNNAFVSHLDGVVEILWAYETGNLTRFDMDDAIVKQLIEKRPVIQKFQNSGVGFGN